MTSDSEPLIPYDKVFKLYNPINVNLLCTIDYGYFKTLAAKEYKKTPVQILLRFHLQRVVLPIPKSSKQDRLKENFDIFNFELTPHTMGIRSITLLIFRT